MGGKTLVDNDEGRCDSSCCGSTRLQTAGIFILSPAINTVQQHKE